MYENLLVIYLGYYFLLGFILNYKIDSISCNDILPNNQINTYLDKNFIESVYIRYKVENNIDKNVSICTLPKIKKMVLCERIFHQLSLMNINLHIYVNKIAFFINNVECEKKIVNPIKTIFFINLFQNHEMYPCFGRHKVVETNYRLDDYYDKFYLSAGLSDDSVFIYVREYTEPDSYNIHSYHENLLIKSLPNKPFFDIKKISSEFKLNNKIIFNDNVRQLEYIYFREKDMSQMNDVICNLNEEMKFSLCKLIFDLRISKNFPNIGIDPHGFRIFGQSDCVYNKLKMNSIKQCKNKRFQQKMFPCFGRDRASSEISLKGKYFTYFYISEGPRENSVLIYMRNQENKSLNNLNLEFTLLRMVENIKIDNLKSRDPEEMIKLEGTTPTHVFLTQIFSALTIRGDLLALTNNIKRSNLTKILNIRKSLEMRRYHQLFTQPPMQVLEKKLSDITFLDEDPEEINIEILNRTFMIDEIKIMKEIDKMFEDIIKIMPKNDEEMKSEFNDILNLMQNEDYLQFRRNKE